MTIANHHDKVKVGNHKLPVSSLPSVRTWLRDLANLKGLHKDRTPQWDLEIMAQALTRPPFKTNWSIGLKFLTYKTAFQFALNFGQKSC